MAPFRAREANPEGWDLKMNFWVNCINKWSLHSRNVVFTAEDVTKAFERGSKRPDVQCIQLVLSHMKRNKNVITLDEFKAMTDSSNKSWINWGLNTFVVKPFSLGLSFVSSVSGSKNDEDICEEVLPEIKSASKIVSTQTLQVMSEEVNKLVNRLEGVTCIRMDNLFLKCKNQLNITSETFDAIVAHLESENKLRTFVDNGIRIVKVGRNASIKESDIGFIKLEAAKEVLEKDIEKHELEIESIRDEAKVCVANKNREKAILLLKKKKRIETKLFGKVTQLDNLEVLIDKLLNSSSHNLVVQAYQKANEALKSANNSQEEVENTMDEVQETLDRVSDLVSEVNRPLVSTDTDDYEQELDELLNEMNDRKADEEEKRDQELAQVLKDLSVNDQSLSGAEESTANRAQLEAQ